jgi:cysteine-rich repeat protein
MGSKHLAGEHCFVSSMIDPELSRGLFTFGRRMSPLGRFGRTLLAGALGAGLAACGGGVATSAGGTGASSGSSSSGGQGGQGGEGPDVCGDSLIGSSEDCDDGNAAPGDGCGADCLIESGFTCTGQPSACGDVDECATNADNCDANATCANTPGSFVCACNPGFSGSGVLCSDVDECVLGTDNCAVNATCSNSPGSFSCACDPPLMGDGVTCTASFNGQFGASWQMMATGPEFTLSLMAYHPTSIPLIYNMYGLTGQSYDPATDTWTPLGNSAPYSGPWTSMAPVAGKLYMIRYNKVYSYDPPTDAWSTLVSVAGSDDLNMTESDEHGHVFGHLMSGDIVDYDTVTATLSYYPTGQGSQFQTKMGYDPLGRAIFFGASDANLLYRFDLTSKVVTQVASHPENQLGHIFCSDRSGHIYIAGDSAGTSIYQYDIATDTYTPLPPLPVDHGSSGTCVVSETGWLYVGTGDNGNNGSYFYRIQLF